MLTIPRRLVVQPQVAIFNGPVQASSPTYGLLVVSLLHVDIELLYNNYSHYGGYYERYARVL